MAKVKRLDNGKYIVQVYDVYGRRHRPKFDKKGEAEAFIGMLEKVKYDMKLSKANLRKARVTFEQALDDFANTKKELRPKSVQKYNNVIKQFRIFVESLNIAYLDEFTSDHATEFYNALISERPDPKGNTDIIMKAKPKTVNFYIQTIKAFFREEVIKGRLLKSPLLHVKNLKVEKKKPDFYTEDELNKFFAQDMPYAYRNAFLGLLHTGCRIAELANITWENVDLQNRVIHIKSNGNFRTKTANSERVIPMNDVLFNLLTDISRNKVSVIYPFSSVEGKQIRERHLLRVCKDYACKAGIVSRVYLHKFRSTFASHLIQRGFPLERIQALLGHATITETQQSYAHLKSDSMHNDVEKINDLIKPLV